MSLAEVIVTTTIALFVAAALMTAHRALKARARAARREQIARREAEGRTGFTVTPADRVYDHTLDDPQSEYWQAWERELSDDRGRS